MARVQEVAVSKRFAVDAVCLGETMALVAPEDPVSLESAGACTLTTGGAESNVAIHLAALGHRVRWASKVGDDPLGRRIVAAIRSAGVDTELVEVAESVRTGVYFKDPHPSGTTVHYYRDGSAASTMDEGFLGGTTVDEAALLHLSGITPALSPTCARLTRSLLTRRRAQRVSFDVNFRPALWSAQRAAPVLRELAQLADLVFVGLDEANVLWGVETPDEVRGLIDEPETVIVKDAAVAAHVRGSDAASVPAPRVEVVEPVGAGDAFAAGYLSGVLRGADVRSCLRLGHILAAHSLLSTADHTSFPGQQMLARLLELDDQQWADVNITGKSDG